MEDVILKFLKGFDLQNLIAMAFILWWMLKPIKEEIKDLDRRLCRIEGALTSKDCCMLKNDGQLKKAE